MHLPRAACLYFVFFFVFITFYFSGMDFVFLILESTASTPLPLQLCFLAFYPEVLGVLHSTFSAAATGMLLVRHVP